MLSPSRLCRCRHSQPRSSAGGSGILIPGPDQLRVGILTGDVLRLTDLEGGQLATMPLPARSPLAGNATQTRLGLRVTAWVDSRTFDLLDGAEAPCPAMEFAVGRFWCGLARDPSLYLGVPHFANRFLRPMVERALSIGNGCDTG